MAAACCGRLREPITAGPGRRPCRMLKALAGPTRLRPVSLAAARENGEACVCDFAASVQRR
jgi:ArsR family transcriptional regulator, arsenate/arsenite/antimonite-responsive transcriptional repressor